MHVDLICALARLCKEQIVRSVCWPVSCLCPFAGSLNPLGLTQVLSFSFAQHFKNMSMQINTLTVNPTMKGGVKHFFFFVTKLLLCMGGNHRPKPLTYAADGNSTVRTPLHRIKQKTGMWAPPHIYTALDNYICKCILSGQITELVELMLKVVTVFERNLQLRTTTHVFSPNPCYLATEYQSHLIHID